MLRSLYNKNGIMGLTLSGIGLFLASSILLVVIISLLFLNDGQRVAELNSMGTSFSSHINGIDVSFFENITRFQFPHKFYPYTVNLSTEYLVLSAPGHWNTVLSVKNRFFVTPWPQNQTLNPEWKTGNELHSYCMDTLSNHTGRITDPIDPEHRNKVQLYLSNYTTFLRNRLARYPLQITIDDVVYVEKVMMYYDIDGNGSWDDTIDEHQDLILIYQ